MRVRLSPWWVACFLGAVEAGMWSWARYLAEHPQVEVT